MHTWDKEKLLFQKKKEYRNNLIQISLHNYIFRNGMFNVASSRRFSPFLIRLTKYRIKSN